MKLSTIGAALALAAVSDAPLEIEHDLFPSLPLLHGEATRRTSGPKRPDKSAQRREQQRARRIERKHRK